jgi:hypothetical protein
MSPQQLAQDVVSIGVHWEGPLTLRVRLRIVEGFHINANVADKGLIATRLSVVPAAAIEYPAAQREAIRG